MKKAFACISLGPLNWISQSYYPSQSQATFWRKRRVPFLWGTRLAPESKCSLWSTNTIQVWTITTWSVGALLLRSTTIYGLFQKTNQDDENDNCWCGLIALGGSHHHHRLPPKAIASWMGMSCSVLPCFIRKLIIFITLRYLFHFLWQWMVRNHFGVGNVFKYERNTRSFELKNATSLSMLPERSIVWQTWAMVPNHLGDELWSPDSSDSVSVGCPWKKWL